MDVLRLKHLLLRSLPFRVQEVFVVLPGRMVRKLQRQQRALVCFG